MRAGSGVQSKMRSLIDILDLSVQELDGLIKTAIDIGENPEKCQDFIKRCELLKQKIDIELQIIALDEKIFKDDNNVLEELEKKKYDCEFAAVQADNDINTLTFMLDKANGKKE